MATESPPQPTSNVAPVTPRDGGVVDERLRRTGRLVKLVDLGTLALVGTIGLLTYLLVATLLDHWVVPGGLGALGRTVAFLTLAGLLGAYGWWMVWPVVRGRVNPIYSAEAIEHVRPSLKNGLINLLLLRREPETLRQDSLAGRVYRGLEQTTASEVAQVPVEVAVDRSPMIRLGYVLIGLMLIAAIYVIGSPKSPMASFGRVLFPWTDVPVPTRVRIADVTPGDITAMVGDKLTVSAMVTGLDDAETVTLIYSTSDGQTVDQAVPMREAAESVDRFEGPLPGDGRGLSQPLTYYLAAGDARTRLFAVHVDPSLTIPVESVAYDFPEYTGLTDRIERGTGDVRAVEGTRVTLRAMASQAIDWARIELDCDPRQSLPMGVQERAVEGTFALEMQPDEPSVGLLESYQIRCADVAGRRNRRPVRHEIQVIPDERPTIRLVDPPEERIELPQNGRLTLQVEAEDPDFGLTRVSLVAERDEPIGRAVPIEPMLDRVLGEPPHRGTFEGTYDLIPGALGLKPGDQIIYWAEAHDNKQTAKGLKPNRGSTPRRWITVTEPQAGADDSAEQGEEGQGEEGQGEEGQGEEGQGEEGQGEEGQGEEGQGEEGQGEEGQGEEGQGEEGQGEEGQGEEGQGEEGQGEEGQGEEGQGEEGQGEEGQGEEGQGEEGQGEEGQGEEGQGEEGQGEEGQGEEGQGEEGQGEEGQGEGGQGKQGQGGGGDPKKASKQDGPIDGPTNPGDAMREILDHLKEKKGDTSCDKGGDGEASDGSPQDDQAGGEKTGEQPDGGKPEPSSGAANDQQGGKSGEGQSAEQDAGSPKPQEANQPTGDPTTKPDNTPSDKAGEEKSPSTSPKQSPAQGDTSADRSGGSQEGGGQRSPQPGQGTAGSQQSADKGAGQSAEPGEGETSTEPGDATPGTEPGTEQRTGRPGQEATGQETPGEGASGEPRGQGTIQEGDADGQLEPGGGTMGTDREGSRTPSELREEQANREFAEKQTELVLEYLEDQLAKDQPDQELLDRLGWDRDDAKRFVDQWRTMFDRADQRTPEGGRDLDRALKSLGLRSHGTELSGGTYGDDPTEKLDSSRFEAPPSWLEQLRAYNQAIAEEAATP